MDVLRRGGLHASADDARMVLAVIDGALLRALAEGSTAPSAVTVVERLLRAMTHELQEGPDRPAGGGTATSFSAGG